jgi:mycofactocin glycosyltransferase
MASGSYWTLAFGNCRMICGAGIAAGSLLLGLPLVGWARRRSALDPIRYTVAGLADDIACGAGVWAGCLAHRTAAPLRPVVTWRQRRIDSPESENRHG